MALKNRTLTLEFVGRPVPGQPESYKVVRVKNSTDYAPGQVLTKNAVDS
jgi:hypothetical protein